MTSKFGTKTYSRPQKICQSSIQFDQAFGDKKKPSAAKSTGILHRWGKTSFTSIRSSGSGSTNRQNGKRENHPVTDGGAPKSKRNKLDPKPVVEDDPFTFDLEGSGDFGSRPTPTARDTESTVVNAVRKSLATRPNKFFKSGNSLSRRSYGRAGGEEPKTSPVAVVAIHQPTVHARCLIGGVQTVEAFLAPVVAVEDLGHFPEREIPFVSEGAAELAVVEGVGEEEDGGGRGEEEDGGGQGEEEDGGGQIEEEDGGGQGEEEAATTAYSYESNDVEVSGRVETPPEEMEEDVVRSEEEKEEEPVKDSVIESELDIADPVTGSSPEPSVLSQDSATESSSLASGHFSFRTRRIFNSPKKANKKSLYKHRLWQEEPPSAKQDEEEEPREQGPVEVVQPEEVENRLMLTRVTSWSDSLEESVTSIRCSKKSRELYTVVKNVKQAHQCHESGETQEFNDDIEYLLEGIQETNGVGTRCLSILSLASKCMAPAFRMHLRAHGTFTKVFSALHDAPGDANLSLCTATVLFILSQDRLNMDLERNSLELMLQLLDVDTRNGAPCDAPSKEQAKEHEKNRQKVRELCDQLHKTGHAKHLELDNISSSTLAMETLLSLTSRQAGEWFKEELRDLGGLDHIVGTVSECGEGLDEDCSDMSEPILERLRKMDRCLRVLENVTFMNVQNQSYLIECKDSTLIVICVRALTICEKFIYKVSAAGTTDESTTVTLNCALSILKVFLNLSNESPLGSERIGKEFGLIDTVLRCVLRLPKYVGPQQRFDLLILGLGLLVNLVEHCHDNRKAVLRAASPLHGPAVTRSQHSQGTAVKALVELFLEHEEAARQEEAKTDSLLDGKGDGEEDAKGKDGAEESRAVSAQTLKDEIEETITKALQKAGKHMEDSMIAAYVALLLGCLIHDEKENKSIVRDHLPQGDFQVMVQILKKFMNFMNLTSVVGNAGVKSIQRVIDVLEAS